MSREPYYVKVMPNGDMIMGCTDRRLTARDAEKTRAQITEPGGAVQLLEDGTILISSGR